MEIEACKTATLPLHHSCGLEPRLDFFVLKSRKKKIFNLAYITSNFCKETQWKLKQARQRRFHYTTSVVSSLALTSSCLRAIKRRYLIWPKFPEILARKLNGNLSMQDSDASPTPLLWSRVCTSSLIYRTIDTHCVLRGRHANHSNSSASIRQVEFFQSGDDTGYATV